MQFLNTLLRRYSALKTNAQGAAKLTIKPPIFDRAKNLKKTNLQPQKTNLYSLPLRLKKRCK